MAFKLNQTLSVRSPNSDRFIIARGDDKRARLIKCCWSNSISMAFKNSQAFAVVRVPYTYRSIAAWWDDQRTLLVECCFCNKTCMFFENSQAFAGVRVPNSDRFIIARGDDKRARLVEFCRINIICVALKNSKAFAGIALTFFLVWIMKSNPCSSAIDTFLFSLMPSIKSSSSFSNASSSIFWFFFRCSLSILSQHVLKMLI